MIAGPHAVYWLSEDIVLSNRRSSDAHDEMGMTNHARLSRARPAQRTHVALGYRAKIRQVGVTIGSIVDRFELAIIRTRRLFTAFAMAAIIGGLVGSPAAFADDDPLPPPPAPEPAHVDIPQVREQCGVPPWLGCEEYWEPPLPLPDTPGTPDRP
jgi:hypothetical protein